ncbi:MAG: serine esterase [Bdellovibrionales bacterium]|nr:serine esterase [Bdellovibrionales bacterium]
MKSTSYSGIQVLERFPAEAQRAIILLHGFGADCTDLASLSEAVDLDEETAWFFPNGPHEVPIGPHMMGRAWFPLRLAELQERGVDFTQELPTGMEQAVANVTKVVTAICRAHRLSFENVILGGFSQGSMIALGVAIQLAEAGNRIGGLTLFSSTLVAERVLVEKAKVLAGLRFLQSHGTLDSVLPFELAERLERVLVEAGLDGMLLPFRGGHEIPMPVLREWQSWLKG